MYPVIYKCFPTSQQMIAMIYFHPSSPLINKACLLLSSAGLHSAPFLVLPFASAFALAMRTGEVTRLAGPAGDIPSARSPLGPGRAETGYPQPQPNHSPAADAMTIAARKDQTSTGKPEHIATFGPQPSAPRSRSIFLSGRRSCCFDCAVVSTRTRARPDQLWFAS